MMARRQQLANQLASQPASQPAGRPPKVNCELRVWITHLRPVWVWGAGAAGPLLASRAAGASCAPSLRRFA